MTAPNNIFLKLPFMRLDRLSANCTAKLPTERPALGFPAVTPKSICEPSFSALSFMRNPYIRSSLTSIAFRISLLKVSLNSSRGPFGPKLISSSVGLMLNSTCFETVSSSPKSGMVASHHEVVDVVDVVHVGGTPVGLGEVFGARDVFPFALGAILPPVIGPMRVTMGCRCGASFAVFEAL
eukprot:CAMPEP_0169306454 /NCGR_PEP_ID=MMETSP1017-20121227/727_1 /TAXON_ID=342587 /ORGANISM="Karlodinium micrum, Strain CCMP2283" /LENGTH=180 /DNA_ID=CAMNT_0009399595 /DNA_START=125 /DNA_END=667 /DNA_ORIENTATION=+